MIIVMRPGAPKKELKEVLQKIRKLGYKTHIIHGVERDVIGAIGSWGKQDPHNVTHLGKLRMRG